MNPVILYVAGAAIVGGVGGFFAGRGASGIGNTVKYVVIGASLVAVGRTLKVI